jgi:hypothetical protein
MREGKIYIDRDNPMVARINTADYPDIDWTTEDGKEELSALGFWAGRQYPLLCHIIFMCGDDEIGELMIAGSPLEPKN